MGLYLERSRDAIGRILNGREGSYLERSYEWSQWDLDTRLKYVTRNVDARVAFLVYGASGTFASMTTRLPAVLENVVASVIKLDSNHLIKAAKQIRNIFADFLLGAFFTFAGFLCPHTTIKKYSEVNEDDDVDNDQINPWITRVIHQLTYSDKTNEEILALSWQTRVLSIFRGLHLAVHHAAKGAHKISIFWINKKPIGTFFNGTKHIILTPLYLGAGVVGIFAQSIRDKLKLKRSYEVLS